jgi:hypothetical protein
MIYGSHSASSGMHLPDSIRGSSSHGRDDKEQHQPLCIATQHKSKSDNLGLLDEDELQFASLRQAYDPTATMNLEAAQRAKQYYQQQDEQQKQQQQQQQLENKLMHSNKRVKKHLLHIQINNHTNKMMIMKLKFEAQYKTHTQLLSSTLID